MASDTEFTSFVMDQLSAIGEFKTKNMFGGTALLKDGSAFAKVKHGALWLKADNSNWDDFLERDMPQYTFGKDNSRRLNFFMTPPDVLDDPEALTRWASKATKAAAKKAL
ncbi:MAG: TfoX/Sxy family protein [Paracoccaceae bacterium]